jgi:hypothetical protein
MERAVVQAAGKMEEAGMTNMEAGTLEKVIVDRTGLTNVIALLMGRSGDLWHDLTHGVAFNVTDEKIRDRIDQSEFILLDNALNKEKNAKYRALKRIALFFNLLADVFKAVEDSIDWRTE